jgi:alkylhydroperoxidase family enzyme
VVQQTLDDYATAPVSDRLKGAIAFIEKMTLKPDELDPTDVDAARRAGVDAAALRDAAAVAAVFNIITRYANALDFAIPTDEEFDKAAVMLLRRGYS